MRETDGGRHAGGDDITCEATPDGCVDVCCRWTASISSSAEGGSLCCRPSPFVDHRVIDMGMSWDLHVSENVAKT